MSNNRDIFYKYYRENCRDNADRLEPLEDNNKEKADISQEEHKRNGLAIL